MKKIDARGMICPAPVIEAKKAIKQHQAVEITVDNLIATQNLSKLCTDLGYGFSMNQRSNSEFAVTITASGSAVEQEQVCKTSGVAVAISKDSMGSGSEELGKILIKGFVYSLLNLDSPPSVVVFFNSGVLLTTENASTLDDLKQLEGKGTRLLVCGTCADYFNIKDKIKAGSIVNMYEIVSELSASTSVINI